MQIWPEQALLFPVFAESRVKRALQLCNWLLPPFMVLVLVWGLYLGGWFTPHIDLLFALKQQWEILLISEIYILSIPIFLYIWSGKRAQLVLDKKLKTFYLSTCQRLTRVAVENPTRFDLAVTLADGIRLLGTEFLRDL